MSPPLRDRMPPVALVAVVVAVAIAAVVLLFARGGGGDDLSTGPPVRVQSVLTPRTVLFGDTLNAHLVVAVDSDRVDPLSIRVVQSGVGRYRPVAPPTIGHRELRGADYVSWTAAFRCLELACLPDEDGTRVRLGPARVTYSLAADDVRIARTVVVRWPPVVVHSRIDPAELAARDPRGEPPWRADLGALPAATYRASPTLFAAILFGLGAILTACALALLSPVLRPLLKRRRRRAGVRLPPLEQALELLERDGGRDVQAQREALELVAAELGRRGEYDLELSARRVAWSEDPPSRADTLELVRNVRGLNGSNGRAA